MKKILGIDLGITSVGWGVITDEYKIIASGVRLFEEADASNNEKRRDSRGKRRLKRRQKQRLEDLKKLLLKEGIISEEFPRINNPYEIRSKGLDEKLNNQELAAAIFHIVKRRGSSLETVEDEKTKNEKSPKLILNENDKLLKDHKYISRVQLHKLKQDGIIRGINNVFRLGDYVKEAKKIMSNQNLSSQTKEKIIEIIQRKRHYSEGPGNYFSPTPYGRYRELTGSEKGKALEIIKKDHLGEYKKSKFEIECDNNKYIVLKSGKIINKEPLNLIELMRGKCSLYPEKLRAPKMSFSAEVFNLLNDLNNIKINSREDKKITIEEKKKIIEVIKEKGDFKPKGIKGLAKLLDVDVQNITGARTNAKEEQIITEFKGYKKYLKAIETKEILNNEVKLDEISEILTRSQVVEERVNELKEMGLSEREIQNVANLTGFNGYHALSLKAIYELNKEMLVSGDNQQQIITKKTIEEISESTKLELDDKLILSPVVKRVHREALKVVTALIKEFGPFDRIVIETTREKNSEEEKANISKRNKRNLELKNAAEDILEEIGYNDPINKGQLNLKLRLYKEQHGKCAYSNLAIDVKQLVNDPRSFEVDHIIPYSISFDNSFNNKVLVMPSVNQLKGNMTPFGYFMSGKASKFPISSFSEFKSYVSLNKSYSKYKRNNLLLEKTMSKFSDREEFLNRNLNDTSYAIREFMATLKRYFKAKDEKTTVVTIKGKQTNLFRGIAIHEWNKSHDRNSDVPNPMIKDRDQYMHHAIDALIVAGLSQQKLFRYLYNAKKSKEDHIYDMHTGEIFESDPRKDSELIKYLKAVSNVEEKDVRFSWKIDSKVNRQFSDETVYSTRIIDEEHVVVKKYKDIYQMKTADLSKIFDSEKKKKLLVYKHDKKTYDIMEAAYNAYKQEPYPFGAFSNEHGKIRKYSKKGNGPEISNLKYLAYKLKSHKPISSRLKFQPLNKKIVLLQRSPYRIDVYKGTNGEFKFITIRYIDMQEKKNVRVIDEKKYNGFLEEKGISESFEFIFSLHRNNCIKLIKKGEEEKGAKKYRFIGTKSDASNTIELKPLEYKSGKDNRITPTISKNTIDIAKYNVSPIGVMNKVTKEELKLSIKL